MQGADAEIVRAAMASARQTCMWPWRLEFEQIHQPKQQEGPQEGDLVLELEDEGYACHLGSQDASCFITPQKIEALRAKCGQI